MTPDVPPVAGERTWTIRRDLASFAARVVTGPQLRRGSKVEVVELSRLRAAEEERDNERTLGQWLRSEVEAVLEEFPPSNYSWARRLNRALMRGIPTQRDLELAAELAEEIPGEALAALGDDK